MNKPMNQKKRRLPAVPKYQKTSYDPQNMNPENIDRQVVELVPAKSSVLELGCATGFMGQWLKEKKNCTVYGIELADAEREQAKKVLEQVYKLDLSLSKELETFQDLFVKQHGQVDVILATSILEHLQHPEETVRLLKTFLKPNGILIATTPNIAHWSTRLMLLFGRFQYQKYGIMDDTHLKFFTFHTFQDLFQGQGYAITHVSIDAEGGGFGRICIPLSKIWPNLFGYQILVQAIPTPTHVISKKRFKNI